MNTARVITQLKDIRAYTKDNVCDEDPTCIWKEDIIYLNAAIEIINRYERMLDWIKQQEQGEVLASVLRSFGFTDEEIESEV